MGAGLSRGGPPFGGQGPAATPGHRAAPPAALLWAAAVGAALLAGCASQGPAPTPAPPPLVPPASAPAAQTAPAAAPAPRPPGAEPLPQPDASGALLRPRARWVPVDWDSLPGLADEQPQQLWPALRASCSRPAPGWAGLCARVLAFQPPDAGFAWQFLRRELQPYRLQALDGNPEGLATGYFEPVLEARRQRQPGFSVPLYRPPADLAQRKPWFSRQDIDTRPEAAAALRERAIAWMASPLDALLLQIQGSGRLRITEPDGRVALVRLAFAGHNDQPYKSVGRWLIEQGELKPEGANWPAIRRWAEAAEAGRVQQMLWSNPRVVFFREEPLPDESLGPRGAQGVPLTPGRSVAVDPLAVPYGTVLWISTTEPLSARPLQRLVVAQDTGGAITGAVRIDYFWGPGPEAEAQAGRMRQPLRAWALWPRSDAGGPLRDQD